MGCTNSNPQGQDTHSNSNNSATSEKVSDKSIPHVFRARYQTGKVLGKGAFATVKLCKNKQTGLKAAVKIVDRNNLNKQDEEGLQQEVHIMQQLQHPHIVQLLDFFAEDKYYYLVIELMEGGELFDRIVKRTYYNEKEARDVVRILVDAIKYCHDRDIVHRDLKPENLLLASLDNDADLKIADFGFAKKDDGSHAMLETQCGTPAYIAPEILRGDHYGKSADMWSIGVITFILLGGYPPFHDKDLKSLFRKIRRGEFEYNPKYWSKVSQEAKDLISGLLTVDTQKRLTADDVLNHPWLHHDDAVLSKNDLAENLEEFKKSQAAMKFKAAVSTVIFVNRLGRMFGNHDTDSASHIRTISTRNVKVQFTEDDIRGSEMDTE